MRLIVRKAYEQYVAGSYRSAIESLVRCGISPEKDANIAYLLGLCSMRLNENTDALNYFRIVTDNDLSTDRVVQCRLLIAFILNRNKRFQEAITELRWILDEGHEPDQAYSMLGYAYYGIGAKSESIAMLRRALQVNEQNLNTVNSLGYILADSRIDIDEGLRLCSAAVAAKPDYPPYLDSLGWAYYCKGDNEKALMYLEQAKSVAPDDVTITEHLNAINKMTENAE